MELITCLLFDPATAIINLKAHVATYDQAVCTYSTFTDKKDWNSLLFETGRLQDK